MRSSFSTKRGLLAGAGVAALSFAAFAAPAYAQNQGDEQDVEGDAESVVAEPGQDTQTDDGLIIVTGSRIAINPNLSSPVPVTAIKAETLVRSSDLALGDALNDLPALSSTFGTSNSGRFIGTAGLSLLDLRGLGTERTLVLVDGRRHVTSTPGDFNVDVNTIPTDLLESVEIVTGGNSAVYGSDAIGGVVNFILRDDFEGIRLKAQNGISSRGDRNSYFISGTAGTNLFDDRVNIAISGEYAKQEPLFFSERPNQFGTFNGTPGFITVDSDFDVQPNPDFDPTDPNSPEFINVPEGNFGDGIPDTVFNDGNPGSTFGQLSEGGALQTFCDAPRFDRRVTATCSGILDQNGFNTQVRYFFLPNGNLVRNNAEYTLTGGTLGGLGSTGIEGGQASVGLTRYAGNLLINADLSPAFKPFLQAKYVHIDSLQASSQATFVTGALNAVYSTDNPFLNDQAREVINSITARPGGGTNLFQAFRFNYDIGTRAENHERDTYRVVAGVRGDLTDSNAGNLRYEVAFNYGRTETFYETGGNVLIENFNNATRAVRAADGTIQCSINADADASNDDPACVPINLFGFGAPSQAAQDYVLYTSSRDEWAEQYNATAFISGDTSGFFELPGGPVGFVVGGEYRRESAFSDFDEVTKSGATFLNSNSAFDPPALEVYEAFGELRVPLLADMPFVEELTATGAVRYSDYNFSGGATAYNASLIYAPIPSLRFRGGYGRSVRAPNLGNLFATQSETFNFINDPCDQNFINDDPDFAARCAEAGIPTTITLPDGSVIPFTNAATSNISGFNSGNPNLEPEVGNSITIGGVFQPEFLPGFSLSIDYYDIEVKKVISGLSAQGIVDQCYGDPESLDNPFCDVVFRRAPTGNIFTDYAFDGQSGRRFPGIADTSFDAVGPGFINQPFNFASLKTSGIDADLSYTTELGSDMSLAVRGLVSWIANREQFLDIEDPDFSTRTKSTLGNPEWEGTVQAALSFKNVTFTYEGRYVGKQTIGVWELQNSHQGREPTDADQFPVIYYPDVFYSDIRLNFELEDKYDFYVGVDNVTDRLPPFGATGVGEGSAIFDNLGRFFYAGLVANF
ncbi:TonB-dependent receptor domain-containing protein [Pelagerythrobacter sp.]|uniref:TonB-dependent receptor domain-containing protein n=1 Tax=Pelagerythrobacter sp. TaxID=2800702 RepID=UPI0035B3178A